MRVAVDARRLQDSPLGGVGRWLANLLPELTAGADIVLLTDKRRPPAAGPYRQRPLAVPGSLPEVAWVQGAAALALRRFEGVFHGTFNQLPFLSSVPAVVSIYDLSFEHHSEDFTPGRRRVFRTQARAAARRARVILTLSEFARRAIVDTYRVPASRVVVVPPAVDGVFSPQWRDNAPAPLSRLGVTGEYVVAIGGAPRRGLPVAVEAWERAVARTGRRVGLVTVGVEAPPPRPGLTHVGAVNDLHWAELLAGAEAFVYPTRYEGYGMPAIEASASGTPVVCARVGALPEVLDAAAHWCPSPGVEDIADGLSTVLSDAALAGRLRTAGLDRVRRLPGWRAAASVVLDAYRTAAEQSL